MSAPVSITDVRGILLDIEGTTTPIAFVHETLFSYAREHVKDYLANHLDAEDVRADIQLLCEEHVVDVNEGKQPPPLTADIESILAYLNWLTDLNRKSTGLKSLQGKIWQEGYSSGTLRAPVFADVAPALVRWRNRGLNISIFSSGSVLAQQLLFRHTEAGDLTPFINNYFDTNTGKKSEGESYRRIAQAVGLTPDEIVFISDVVMELAAARDVGMKTVLSIRPGNQPQEHADLYQSIQSFEEL